MHCVFPDFCAQAIQGARAENNCVYPMAKWRRAKRAAEDYLRVEVCFPEAVVLRKFLRGIHLPRAGKAGVKRDARNPAISAGRRKSAVAAGPIAERCQIFSFLFARRPLKSARLVRVFLSPYGLKSRANFKLRTAFGRRRADCPAGEKLSICRFRFPCPPGLFRFCDPDCPSADVFPLIRKVSLWRLRQVKARFAVRRRRTGGALFAPFPTIARFRG